MGYSGTDNTSLNVDSLSTSNLILNGATSFNTTIDANTTIAEIIEPLKRQIEELKALFLTQTSVTTGSIIPFAGNAIEMTSFSILPPPPNYEWCFGQIVSKTDERYSGLYAVIGDYWNVSTELTDDQFQLPDLRNVFLRGCNTDSPESTNYRAVGNFQACGVPNLKGNSGGIYLAQYASDIPSNSSGCLRTVNSGQTGKGAATVNVAMPAVTIDASLYSSVYKEGLTEVRPDNKTVNYIIKL